MFFQRLKDELPDPAPTAQTDLWYFRTLLCELRNEVSYKHLVVVLAAHLNERIIVVDRTQEAKNWRCTFDAWAISP